MKSKIMFAGGIFRDIVTFCERFPVPGETVFGSKFFVGFGGKAANQAIMCSRFHQNDVYVLGKVGDDENGRAYLDNFAQNGVNTEFVSVEANNITGVASIWVETSSGENKIVIIPGANGLPNSRMLDSFIGQADIIVCGLETGLEAAYNLLSIARASGAAKTVLNAAPMPSVISQLMINLLQLVDILVVNENENDMLPLDVITPPIKVVTLGSRGAFLCRKGFPQIHVPVVAQTIVVDTTGAGDAFIGCLAHFLGTTSMEMAVKLACIVASDSVTRQGTQSSYPTYKELNNLLKSFY